MRISDWSSDVCSSDLRPVAQVEARHRIERLPIVALGHQIAGGKQHERPLQRGRQLRLHRPAGRCNEVGDGLLQAALLGQRRQLRQVLGRERSEEHTSELQSLMRISYAVFCLKKKTKETTATNTYYA